MISEEMRQKLLRLQKAEITQHHIYLRLSSQVGGENGEILAQVANDEFRHYMALEVFTREVINPSFFTIWFYLLLGKIFGITFVIKYLEQGEEEAEKIYDELAAEIPEAAAIKEDEERHEHELIALIDEERLSYISSMVLGVNDALVELTGALAGLTFVLGSTRITGTAGLITGISASLSMAASEYLSQKSEIQTDTDPLKASIYTGIMYVAATLILIIPYFVFTIPLAALFFTLFNAALIIVVFTFFLSVVKETSFRRSFTEMIILSFGVAGISFLIGIFARTILKVGI